MIEIHADGGSVVVRAESEVIAVLRQLPGLLRSVGRAGKDPAADRLTPHAYLNDDAAAEEFDRLMLPELEAGRVFDRDLYLTLLEGDEGGVIAMNGDEALAVLRVLDEARLVMAARLGIDSDDWEPPRSVADSSDLHLYHLLGWIQDGLIEASEPLLLGDS